MLAWQPMHCCCSQAAGQVDGRAASPVEQTITKHNHMKACMEAKGQLEAGID
jgi:hypothetical protein